jgi:hypothetical protein
MAKKILLILCGLLVGAIVPYTIASFISSKTSFYSGNLNKYNKVSVDFRKEVKDNFIIGHGLFIKGKPVMEIGFQDNFSIYSIGSFIFYNYEDSTRTINDTYSTQYYHDSCFFYMKVDTMQ